MKNKLVFILLIIIFIIVLISTGIYINTYDNLKIREINSYQNELLQGVNIEIDYMEELSYDDILNKLININDIEDNTNIVIEINDKALLEEDVYSFDEYKSYKLKIKLGIIYNNPIIGVFNKEIENEKVIEIVIKDKEKPVINGVSNKEINVGDNINLTQGITAFDNVDGNIEVKIEGEVDNQKAGTYNIKVIAQDKSGNISEEVFDVVVIEKVIETNIDNTISNNISSSENYNNKSNNTTSNNNNNSNNNKGNNNSNNNKGNNNSNNNGNNGAIVDSEALSKRYIEDILRLTNQYRSEAGVSALVLDANLSNAAFKRAMEIVSTPSHMRPDGTICFTIFDEFGIYALVFGENIAFGQRDGETVAKAWRNSQGHYQNMINSSFTKIGIGAYYVDGKWYWVQLFTS